MDKCNINRLRFTFQSTEVLIVFSFFSPYDIAVSAPCRSFDVTIKMDIAYANLHSTYWTLAEELISEPIPRVAFSFHRPTSGHFLAVILSRSIG